MALYRKDRTFKKTDTNEVKRLLRELRESIAGKPSPFEGMSKEEVIQHMRKTRKTLWEKKLALRP
jgi:hypothetical protein